MAAFDYITSRADADELIEEFGTLAYLRRSANTGTAWEPTVTTQDYATFAVRIAFTQRQMAGGNVQLKDQRWLVAAGPLIAAGVEPAVPDSLVVSGEVLPILVNDPLSPAGTGVLFDCHIRL